MFKYIELVFVFISKIYIFFYKEKKEFWMMFPSIIISTILMINLQLIMSFFFSVSKLLLVTLFTIILLFFRKLFSKTEYNWVVQYPLSKKQKIIIISLLLIDFVIVGVFSEISRNIYMEAHGMVK